jgi:hypothetical protein
VSDGKAPDQQLNQAMIKTCCSSGYLDQAGMGPLTWAMDWKQAVI